MSTQNDDFDLDEILDSALDEFEDVEKKEEEGKKEETESNDEDATLDEISKLLEGLEAGNTDNLFEEFSKFGGDIGDEEFKKMMEEFENKPEFSEMMNEMKTYIMSQLQEQGGDMLSKDVYYEPIKELEKKLEQWLNEKSDLTEQDRNRHQEQLKIIKQMSGEYEKEDHSSQAVFELMMKLEEHGSLPNDVLGEGAGDLSPEQLKQLTGEMGENCNVM